MIGFPPAIRIHLATSPTDMRRGFDGLAALVQGYLGEDPLSGNLFVFRNRRGDRLKILWWDRTGYCTWYKRLEKGTFRFPEASATRVEVDAGTLSLILEGIDLQGIRRLPRYRRHEDG